MRSLALLPLLGLLAACATPQQRCIAEGTKDLRVVRSLIDETRQNLDRGYAMTTETRVTPQFRVCTGTRAGVAGVQGCWDNRVSEQRKPVSIDLAAERRKLEELERKERELARRAADRARQCQARYPS
ncbi:hypothetical protein BV394_07070 [Brevirhabdus pacifica]|uniref:Uncharacterized protein n=1 Tax=Brevirhabdus pacifica TaxID=1267768 RepID=A0A1U7DHV1_9RHOB|nr:hypothetical protein [Brevirhabdus pacifica]APX89505.1 hypothetical protein BV394_07070 [Brevirhabdus pacifica]OWU76487.1 hypothetical protein ATO5_09230 [Loktanella sp. 22II-4b]PJJ85842.1 hypothetical protein CLV77_0372 [Brevirhabdus pacifica]